MWSDAEAHNEFLQDLLFKYGSQLDVKNAEICALKEKIVQLKEKIAYYEKHNSFIGNIYAEPAVVTTPSKGTITFNINKPIASVQVEEDGDNYHIISKIYENKNNTVMYRYVLSKPMLLSAKDKVGILAFLNKKALKELEKHLDKGAMV